MAWSVIRGPAALALSGLLLNPAWADPGVPGPAVPRPAATAPQDAPRDVDGDEKRAQEEWRRAQERQGAAEGQAALPENPLLEILELMEQVESRLFEANTGAFTQEEQRRIIEAMRFEDKTSAALEDLIRRIEEQPG